VLRRHPRQRLWSSDLYLAVFPGSGRQALWAGLPLQRVMSPAARSGSVTLYQLCLLFFTSIRVHRCSSVGKTLCLGLLLIPCHQNWGHVGCTFFLALAHCICNSHTRVARLWPWQLFFDIGTRLVWWVRRVNREAGV